MSNHVAWIVTFALCRVVKSERRTFFSLQRLISVFLGSDLALMHGLPPCICRTNVWPAAVIEEQRGEKKNIEKKKQGTLAISRPAAL